MPKPGLPPLPPLPTWSSYLPKRSETPRAARKTLIREFPKRIALANRWLADEVTRSLDIRPDEVIIEAFSGTGMLTRSLLAGGERDEAAEEAQRQEWWKRRGQHAPTKRPSKASGKWERAEGYPRWIQQFDPEKRLQEPPEHRVSKLPVGNKPKLVVAVEPSPDDIIAGLGYEGEQLYKDLTNWTTPAMGVEETTAMETEEAGDLADHERAIFMVGNRRTYVAASQHEDRLVLAAGDPWQWHTIPTALSDPLVQQHLPAPDPSLPPEEGVYRKWSAPKPHITLIANMAYGKEGEALMTQWLPTAIGAAEGKPSFMWRWGRMRLAVLLNKNIYDRMTAMPGELSYSKNAAMLRSLYHVRPLAPFHHVTNVDRSSMITYNRPLSHVQALSENARKSFASYGDPDTLPRTPTYPADFWPASRSGTETVEDDANARHIRTPLIGLLLEPKLNPNIKLAQKDDWDFVVRSLFVRQASTLEAAIGAIGFSANNLLDKIEGREPRYSGAPTSRTTMVRDLRPDQLERIVDVFCQWPFKPKHVLFGEQFEVQSRNGRHASSF